jgi:hypothetical protein
MLPFIQVAFQTENPFPFSLKREKEGEYPAQRVSG